MDSPRSTFPRQSISPPSPPEQKPRFARVRAWLRTRNGRIALPIATFLLGILLGISCLLLYALSIAGDVAPLPPGTLRSGAITVQVSPVYMAALAQQKLASAGMPGTVQNVQVRLVRDGPITVTGEDQFSLLGLSMMKHFTLILQPYVQTCQLQVHVLHADMGGIPVTGLVAAFESQINQELRVKVSELPKGFLYCTVGVQTEPQALFIVYSATPIASSSPNP
jgi:hypothetical protein